MNPADAKNTAGFAAATRLNLGLAWRFFGAGRKHALVSMISTISIVGMTIAVALLVLVLSVMNGFEREFRDRILGMVPHARIWLDQPVPDPQQLLDKIEQNAAVKSVLPFIEFKALATAGTYAQPLLVQGTDIQRFLRFANDFVEADASGRRLSGLAHGELVMGAKLAAKLGLSYGSSVRIMIVEHSQPGNGRASIAESGPQSVSGRRGKTAIYPLRVAGLLRTGTEIDESIALMNIDDAARINKNIVPMEGLQLQFVDVFGARDMARRIALQYELRGRMSDWTREYGNLYTAIQLSRQLVVLLLASIIAVAVFNVFITLGMVVRHKRPEIAILRSMGLAQKQILRVFVWQGLLISLLGCGLGLLLGCALAALAPEAVNALQQSFGHEFLSTDIYPINYLPAQIKARDLALIAGVALFMSLIATLVPARRAARLNPAEVLSGQAR